jgi:hypothetical protein
MSKAIRQCPFLEGADKRCSSCFRLEHLNEAFRYCFGRYKACPTYLQLQVEDRMRSMESAAVDAENTFDPGLISISIGNTRRRATAPAIAGASCG